MTAANFLWPHRTRFDLIIPVPPSNKRNIQPVIVLAQGIGAALSLPMPDCVTLTRPPSQLKDVTDPSKRTELLKGLYRVDSKYTGSKNILLFDDLFRSGSTLNALTDALLQEGEARNVYALTITRTRSKR